MYKSAIGIFISNIFMILLILLNNEGPGWEVPVDTMVRIGIVWLAIIIGLVFSVGTLLISIKQLKIKNFLFKLSFFSYFFLSLLFFSFLISVEANNGQYWHQNFPYFVFSFLSIGINILIFAVISVFRFRRTSLTDKHNVK